MLRPALGGTVGADEDKGEPAREIERLRARVRALETLDSVARFALENEPHAFYLLEADASIVYVNPATCELMGYTKDEMLAMKVTDLNVELDEGALVGGLGAAQGGRQAQVRGQTPTQRRSGADRGDPRRVSRARRQGVQLRVRPRHQSAQGARAAPATGGENGGDGPARRRYRARLQQPACSASWVARTCCAAKSKVGVVPCSSSTISARRSRRLRS